MSVAERYSALVQETGGVLPPQLKPFQLDTLELMEERRHVLVSVPTGQGKTLVQLNAARLLGGKA